MYTKLFTVVSKYDVINFSFKVDVPPVIIFSDGSFPLTISATYDYGKPVRGQVVVECLAYVEEFNFDFFDFSSTLRKTLLFSRTLNISSPTTLNVDIARDLKLNGPFDSDVFVEATFTSEYTGETANLSLFSTYLAIVEFNQFISISGPSFYKSDIPFDFEIFIKTFDGKPVRIYFIF